MHKIIGLTGGSGAGKSAAAVCFARLGAGVVDADAVYRGLCESSRTMLDALARAFGDIYTKTGALDRAKLARLVFSDPEKLKLLNEITFPWIRAASVQAFEALAADGHALILYDAPTLFQTGGDALCSGVIGVVAARDIRLQRIITRDKLPMQAAEARVDSQPDSAFYRQRCRYIIENDGTMDELCGQVREVFARIMEDDEGEDSV